MIEGYKFQFYSSDESEPPHMHVLKSGNVAKIWLESFQVQYNRGYSAPEINRVIRLTRANNKLLKEKWNAHFGKRRR